MIEVKVLLASVIISNTKQIVWFTDNSIFFFITCNLINDQLMNYYLDLHYFVKNATNKTHGNADYSYPSVF